MPRSQGIGDARATLAKGENGSMARSKSKHKIKRHRRTVKWK
jgi:hypothetical protein